MTTVVSRVEVPAHVDVQGGEFTNLVPSQAKQPTWLKTYDGAVRVVGRQPGDVFRSTGHVEVLGDTVLTHSTTGEVQDELEGMEYKCVGSGTRFFQVTSDRGPYIQPIHASPNDNYGYYRMASSFGTTCLVVGASGVNSIMGYVDSDYGSGFTNKFDMIFGNQFNDVTVESVYVTSSGFYVCGRDMVVNSLMTYLWVPGQAGVLQLNRLPPGFSVPAQVGEVAYFVCNADANGTPLPGGGVVYRAEGTQLTKLGTSPTFAGATRNDWINLVIDADENLFAICLSNKGDTSASGTGGISISVDGGDNWVDLTTQGTWFDASQSASGGPDALLMAQTTGVYNYAYYNLSATLRAGGLPATLVTLPDVPDLNLKLTYLNSDEKRPQNMICMCYNQVARKYYFGCAWGPAPPFEGNTDYRSVLSYDGTSFGFPMINPPDTNPGAAAGPQSACLAVTSLGSVWFPSYDDKVSFFQNVPAQVSVESLQVAAPHPTHAPMPTTTPQKTSGGLNTAEKIGLGVGTAVAALIIVIGAIYGVKARRSRNAKG